MAVSEKRDAMLLTIIAFMINTEERENLRKKFRDYIPRTLRSQECHDDIGIMVYPAVFDVDMGRQIKVGSVFEEIRTDSDYLKDKPKSELPVSYFSVRGFVGRKVLQNVTEHTGLIVIDIDKQDNPDTDFNELRNRFGSDKYLLACFRSPSGGLKAVFNTNINDKKNHKVYFHAISEYVLKNYPEIAKIDKSGSNMNRACYMPYDANAYFNPHAFRYCLGEQQIAEITEEIKTKKLYRNSLKVILEVDEYSFDDHYDSILNLLLNQTSMGLEMKKKRTLMGIDNESESFTSSDTLRKKRTLVGLYDSVFNKYRFNNIDKYIMSTDVPFFEMTLWKYSYPHILNYKTHIDECYFKGRTQEPLSTDNTLGFEETDGLDFCEVQLPKDGIGVGFRHKTIASMSMKFIFNNPFCHPKRLVEHMQYLNHKYCLNPAPDSNPKPSDEEVQNIVLQNYQKFIAGELDFNKVLRKNRKNTSIMKKYVFHSREYVDICSSYTKDRAKQCYSLGREEKNIRKYGEAIKSLMNGTKITQKSIAEKMGITDRHLRRICSSESNKEFFALQKKLIKKYNSSLKNSEVDDDPDVLDIGRDAIVNHRNILKPKPETIKDEYYPLTEEQKSRIFDRIYSDILMRNDNFGQEKLQQLLYKSLEELQPIEREILSLEPESISDSATFWKQQRLELMLLPLYSEVNSKI